MRSRSRSSSAVTRLRCSENLDVSYSWISPTGNTPLGNILVSPMVGGSVCCIAGLPDFFFFFLSASDGPSAASSSSSSSSSSSPSASALLTSFAGGASLTCVSAIFAASPSAAPVAFAVTSSVMVAQMHKSGLSQRSTMINVRGPRGALTAALEPEEGGRRGQEAAAQNLTRPVEGAKGCVCPHRSHRPHGTRAAQHDEDAVP